MMDKPNIGQALSRYDVALLADGLDACGRREQVLDVSLRPLAAGSGTVVGVARTLTYRALAPHERFPPVDNAKKRRFLQKLEQTFGAGDVLALSMHDDIPECGVLGGLYATMYKNLGVRAIVVDGYVRDRAELETLGLPVYARGTTPRNGTGRVTVHAIGAPVMIGGVSISDGDFIAINADGIVAIPADEGLLAKLLEWLDKTDASERATHDLVASGMLLSDAFERHSRV